MRLEQIALTQMNTNEGISYRASDHRIMSDNVPLRKQQSCFSDEKYLVKIFTYVDDRGNESVERMLYVYVAREEEDLFELNDIEPKDLCQVLSQPFLWKNPKGTMLTVKLATGGFISEQMLGVDRVIQFRFPEKFHFELPNSDAKKLSLDIKLATENRNLWEQKNVNISLFQTKESKTPVEHSWKS